MAKIEVEVRATSKDIKKYGLFSTKKGKLKRFSKLFDTEGEVYQFLMSIQHPFNVSIKTIRMKKIHPRVRKILLVAPSFFRISRLILAYYHKLLI